jgi:hypothetical protein
MRGAMMSGGYRKTGVTETDLNLPVQFRHGALLIRKFYGPALKNTGDGWMLKIY